MKKVELEKQASSEIAQSRERLTYEQEVHAILCAAAGNTESLLQYFEAQAANETGDAKKLTQKCIDWKRDDLRRIRELIPKAERERAIAESQADELQKLKVSYQALWDDRDKMEKRLMGFVREWKRRAITAESQAPKPYSFDVASDEEIARRASGAAQEVSPPSPMTANEAIDLLNARIPVKDKQIILETVRENRGDTRELKAALTELRTDILSATGTRDMTETEFKNEVKLKALVTKVINKHDPEQLLKVGCPADEYEPEIDDIAASLRPSMDVHDVWLIVCNTLHWYFGDHATPVLYWPKHREMAVDIVAGIPDVDLEDSQP
jgi:hypothetical protein